MTVIAVIVLAVWAVGIIATAAGIVMVGREHPLLDMAIGIDPVRACLVLAVVTVFWPSAVLSAGLSWAMERSRR